MIKLNGIDHNSKDFDRLLRICDSYGLDKEET